MTRSPEGLRVALAGSVSSSWHTLRGLLTGRVNVCAVLGLDESHAAGVSDYRSLRELATQAGVPFLSFHRIADPAVLAFVREHRPDLLFVVGLSQLAPPELIALAPRGAIGFHPTPLPQGRGRAPVAWTILLNQPAAANLFFLSDEADAGDIIVQRPVEVRPDDYAQDLIDRTNVVLEAAVVELADALRSGNLPRQPQDPAQATWYARRTPQDGRIDFSQSVASVHRLVRATSRPYPGAFTHDRGQKVIVWRAEPHAALDHFGTVGQVVRVEESRGALVQCGDGLLWLTQTAGEDGRPRVAADFRVGVRLGEELAARVEALEQRLRKLAGEGGAPT